MLKPIVIWGASGHAKVLHEFIGSLGCRLVALFDNKAGLSSPFPEVPLYFGKTGFETWRTAFTEPDADCLVAIGGSRGRDRLELQQFLQSQGLSAICAVHPRAVVAADASLSSGCQILAGAVVGVEVRMGQACIVNTNASVDHESTLGEGVHVAPGVTLAGRVRVGDFSLLGTGAVVLPRITIGSNVVVGAGAVVTRDVPDNKVVYGNPARIIRENS